MEVKSRYEVISNLEKDKRALIIERDGLDTVLKEKQRELKELNRDVEDKNEEIKEFKDKMEDRKETIQELILSIDQSLQRFTKMNETK